MLLSLRSGPELLDGPTIELTTEVPSLSRLSFPDLSSLRCKIITENHLHEDLVELVEECTFPDVGKSRQTVHAAKNMTVWHIVVLPGFWRQVVYFAVAGNRPAPFFWDMTFLAGPCIGRERRRRSGLCRRDTSRDDRRDRVHRDSCIAWGASVDRVVARGAAARVKSRTS
jgi:hypothetical protein